MASKGLSRMALCKTRKRVCEDAWHTAHFRLDPLNHLFNLRERKLSDNGLERAWLLAEAIRLLRHRQGAAPVDLHRS